MIPLHGNEATQGKTLLQANKNSCYPETLYIFDIRHCDMANNSFICFFNGQMIIKAEQHALSINSLHDLIKFYVCN